MDTLTVGKKLVELCNQNKYLEAVETLYSPEIVSTEAMGGGPGMPKTMTGIEAVKGKNQWWMDNHEIHSSSAEGPWPNEDKFIVRFKMDVTGKAGPMAGKRVNMDEAALYTVKDGKIIQEEFFYSM